VKWIILFHEDFEPEFDALPVAKADERFASHLARLKERKHKP
jgi:hypothetical protein